MAVYVLVFLVRWFSMNIADRCFVQGHRRAVMGCAGLAVLFPALVAGFRDISVGTDTQGYILNIFSETMAIGAHPFEIYRSFEGEYQVGYIFLAQVGRLIPDIHAFLFAVALTTFGIAAAALRMFEPRSSASAYLVYLLINFNASMNNSRQAITVSFGLLVGVALIKQRRRTAIGGLIGGFLFHKSGVILLAYLPIYWITEWRRGQHASGERRITVLRATCTGACLLVVAAMVLEFRSLGPALLSAVGLSDEYGIYLDEYRSGTPSALVVGQLVYVVASAVERKHPRGGLFIHACVICGTMSFFLMGISVYLYRVSTYFTSITALVIANLYVQRVSDKDGERISYLALARWVLVLVTWALWYIQIVMWNNHGTFPYSSELLGIG